MDYEVLGQVYPDQFIAGVNEANTIFDLPNTQQSLLYHHAAAGFPPKDTFLDAVWVGNYTAWPGLTTTLILKHFPDLDKMQKGYMKGQQKVVRLNQLVPNHVTTRLLVTHGGHPSGCELYLLQINEEQNQRRDDHGLPKNG
jgi:hypothetical protein